MLGWVTARRTPGEFGHPLTCGPWASSESGSTSSQSLNSPSRSTNRDASDKSSSAARHLAARWAAKEAVIKAWSGSRFAQRPMLREDIHRDIEVVTDMWGRPRVRLTGDIAKHLADVTIHVSLCHEGDTAAAVAILETS
jgi:holo-[acyl-carrier protein] synthase